MNVTKIQTTQNPIFNGYVDKGVRVQFETWSRQEVELLDKFKSKAEIESAIQTYKSLYKKLVEFAAKLHPESKVFFTGFAGNDLAISNKKIGLTMSRVKQKEFPYDFSFYSNKYYNKNSVNDIEKKFQTLFSRNPKDIDKETFADRLKDIATPTIAGQLVKRTIKDLQKDRIKGFRLIQNYSEDFGLPKIKTSKEFLGKINKEIQNKQAEICKANEVENLKNSVSKIWKG